jgi:mannosyltransferase OCH1-like enzyme
MIPRIIHYCWLSGDPIPEGMQLWMESWKKLEGY